MLKYHVVKTPALFKSDSRAPTVPSLSDYPIANFYLTGDYTMQRYLEYGRGRAFW